MKKSNWIIVVFIIIAVVNIFFFIDHKKQSNIESIPDEQETETVMNKDIPSDNYALAPADFDDGLGRPTEKTNYDLAEDGIGLAVVEKFNDKATDITIIRSYYRTATAGYTEYKIERNGVNITPNGFKTLDGADCSLTKFRFVWKPEFSVIKISRNVGDTMIQPTMATKTIYKMMNGKLSIVSETPLREICNVSDLF